MIYGLLVQLGFRKYMIGHGVYVQETKSRINLRCLYVDDLLVIEATSRESIYIKLSRGLRWNNVTLQQNIFKQVSN